MYCSEGSCQYSPLSLFAFGAALAGDWQTTGSLSGCAIDSPRQRLHQCWLREGMAQSKAEARIGSERLWMRPPTSACCSVPLA